MSIKFPCNNCSAKLQVKSGDAGKVCRCPECGSITTVPAKNHVPARAGLTATERLMDAIKLFGFFFAIAFLFMFSLAPFSMIVIVAGALFLLFVVPGYLIVNVGMDMLHRSNLDYRTYRNAGGNFYLDNLLPWKDAPKDFRLPYPEPDYSGGFVPPRSWAFQCLGCHARVATNTGRCWNCGNDLSPRMRRFPLDD